MESIASQGKSREEAPVQECPWPIVGLVRPMGLYVLFSRFRAMPVICVICDNIRNLSAIQNVQLYFSIICTQISHINTNLFAKFLLLLLCLADGFGVKIKLLIYVYFVNSKLYKNK